jgi:hypothetical protein
LKNDKLLVTAILGIVSSIPAEVFTQLLIYFGIGKNSIYQLASLLITFNRPTIIIGFIIDALVASVVAFLFYFVLERLGSDYLIIKVTFGSLLAWFACELVFTATIEGRFFDIRPIMDYYSHIIGAIIFGVTLGLLFKKFLFKKPTS